MAILRVLVVMAVMLVGCGSDEDAVGNDGDVVGGPCDRDRDCAGGSQCARGSDFPGGTCTVRCRDDYDCPSRTACVDEEGGVCLLLCNFDTDCRIGYECDDQSRRGHPGNATVCIDD